MGKLLKIIVVVGIAIGIWVLYVDYSEKQELKRQRLEQQQAARANQAREAQPPPSSASPGLKSSTTTSPPRGTSSQSHYQEVLAAAKDNDVTILSYQEKGNEATIYCKALERNNLGYFLDALVDRGIIRDIDLDKHRFQKVTDRQLRWHFYATYVVKF